MLIIVILFKATAVIVLVSAVHKNNRKRESVTNITILTLDVLLGLSAALFSLHVG